MKSSWFKGLEKIAGSTQRHRQLLLAVPNLKNGFLGSIHWVPESETAIVARIRVEKCVYQLIKWGIGEDMDLDG
jgi:hypothetical protein